MTRKELQAKYGISRSQARKIKEILSYVNTSNDTQAHATRKFTEIDYNRARSSV